MHLFRSKKLIEAFKNKTLTQKDTVNYLIILSLWYLFVRHSHNFLSMEPAKSELSFNAVCIKYFLLIIINLFGVYLCFWKNTKGDSDNFIERFICLSVPIRIKVFFFVLLISVLKAILKLIMKKEIYAYLFEGGGYDFFFNIIFEVIFYLYMITAFEEISEGLSENTPQDTEVIS